MDALYPFLCAHSTLTLATVSPAGGAAAADLYFAADRALNLYFLSEPGSRHAGNLSANSQVAATIHAQAWDWREIKGIQVEGECREVTAAAARSAALARYAKKFDFIFSRAAMNAFLGTAIERHAIFRISPQWIRWLDNGEAFGHKKEWSLQDGAWVATRG